MSAVWERPERMLIPADDGSCKIERKLTAGLSMAPESDMRHRKVNQDDIRDQTLTISPLFFARRANRIGHILFPEHIAFSFRPLLLPDYS